METSITGRNVELSEPLKAYVGDKLQHLNHSFDQLLNTHVVLSVEKFRHCCEITLHATGTTMHGSHETDDMYASIDGAVDKINRQVKRHRSKLRQHLAQPESREEPLIEDA